MLLQQIVGALDQELDRLRALRSVVAGLQGTFSLNFETVTSRAVETVKRAEAAARVPEAVDVAGPKAVPARRRERSAERAEKPKKMTPAARRLQVLKEARALSSTIPAGPVVVLPAALAKEHSARHEGQATGRREKAPPPERGSLGQMIRALHLDATA